ncbi:hypothetical protein [Streptomyces sp. IBSBF 3136]|uniref:hypothetical protein n=1 Tax=Streptomyces sp. IBSBF 3136 TaxID=2903524 RepID=UPI002FDC4ECC
MKQLTKRIAAAVSSLAITGGAVLGAGGTASAATSPSAHVQHPPVGTHAAAYRWDHGFGHLLDQGCSWDRTRGWHHEDRVGDSARYDRDGRFYDGDDGRHSWKSDGSYGHGWNHVQEDGRAMARHDGDHGDR